MPMTLGDVIAMGKFASRIHELGSSKYTSARQEYKDFMRDIELLGISLQGIITQVENAEGQGALSGSTPLDLTSLKNAIGDVQDTLKRCEKLIKENPKFQWNQGFVRNIEWNFSIGEHVKILQNQLSFHCEKIHLVLDPLKIKLWTQDRFVNGIYFEDIISRLKEIRNTLPIDVQNALPDPTPELTQVDPHLAKRFLEKASERIDVDPFPIAEGINAVAFHYGQSTKQFLHQLPLAVKADAAQYLSLMKCVWILQQVKASRLFESYCRDILSDAYARQLERKVQDELNRFNNSSQSPLQIPDSCDIEQESEQKPEIWVTYGSGELATGLEDLELEIIKAPLQNISETKRRDLVVFRLGDHRIRVKQVITSTRVTVKEIHSQELDCSKIHLNPIYANPSTTDASQSIILKASTSDQGRQDLPFKHIRDLLAFQAAVTNFGVVQDQINVAAIGMRENWSLGKATEIGTKGRAQVWCYRRPEDEVDRHQKQKLQSTSSSPPLRRDSEATQLSNSASPKTWAKSHTRSSSHTSSIREVGRQAFLEDPIASQLVCFTTHQDSLRYVAIVIDQFTRLNPKRCDCASSKKRCNRLVIESDGKLEIRVYDSQGSEAQWNLAVLNHPEHQDTGRDNAEVHKDAKFVTVDFGTEEARKATGEAFQKVCNIMKSRWNDHHTDLKKVKSLHVAKRE